MATARDAKKEDFKVVAMVSDGCITGGMSFEGLQNAGHLGTDMLVILNDNEMFISNRVGALGAFLTKLLTGGLAKKLENEVEKFLKRIQFYGAGLLRVAKRMRVLLFPGMLFEELGFSYFGYGASVRTWGLMGQWAFLTMPLDLAMRVTYTNLVLSIVQAYSLNFEAVVSKALGPINPYALVGFQTAGGSLNLSGLSLPVTVTTPNPSFTAVKTGLGLELKLAFLKIAGEWSTNSQGQNALGGKASLSF
jgi:hypothetical protein